VAARIALMFAAICTLCWDNLEDPQAIDMLWPSKSKFMHVRRKSMVLPDRTRVAYYNEWDNVKFHYLYPPRYDIGRVEFRWAVTLKCKSISDDSICVKFKKQQAFAGRMEDQFSETVECTSYEQFEELFKRYVLADFERADAEELERAQERARAAAEEQARVASRASTPPDIDSMMAMAD
jgi:hypothetical protein